MLSFKAKKTLGSPPNLYEIYFREIKTKINWGLLLLGLVIVVFLLSIAIGSARLGLSEILSSIFQKTNYSHLILNIRITRTLGGILTGAALGSVGAIMQKVLKNPLASPFTLGVSHGAAFGAAFAIIVLEAGQTHSFGAEAVTIFNNYPVVICAFLGSIISILIIIFLSFFKDSSPETIILTGVALNSLFGAATMFLQYFASDFQVAATLFWTFGDLGKAGWLENKIIFLIFLLCFVFFYLNRWNFNLMSWGDEVAKSLGVNIKTLRILSMFLGALVVSVCTAFLGIIGFIGLMSPHIVRFLIGDDCRFLIPYSALLGAFLLCASDLIARTLLTPAILPVGIVTSFAGAPMFFYLLIKRGRP